MLPVNTGADELLLMLLFGAWLLLAAGALLLPDTFSMRHASRVLKYLMPCGPFHSRPRRLNCTLISSPSLNWSNTVHLSCVTWKLTCCGYGVLASVVNTNSRF